MPVINGIYTRNFPVYPNTLADSTIIVVAETGNNVTYRTTYGALRALSSVSNATTSELTAAQLTAAYPAAVVPFEVVCTNITDNPLIYKKGITGWYSIPLGTIS